VFENAATFPPQTTILCLVNLERRIRRFNAKVKLTYCLNTRIYDFAYVLGFAGSREFKSFHRFVIGSVERKAESLRFQP
jgi:hypothetical protein